MLILPIMPLVQVLGELPELLILQEVEVVDLADLGALIYPFRVRVHLVAVDIRELVELQAITEGAEVEALPMVVREVVPLVAAVAVVLY